MDRDGATAVEFALIAPLLIALIGFIFTISMVMRAHTKGEFTVKNGASITGTGVLVYMEGQGSDLFFHSRTHFDLKAPTTGPYAGIVIWSDRANTRDHDIYTKFGAAAEGTIYAPSSQLEFENKVVWEADCIRIVVVRLELDNNSRYRARNPGQNCSNNIPGQGVTLVR